MAEVPEWVQVWRFARSQNDRRSFPQQEGYGDPLNTMSWDDYAEVVVRWEQAGSPKSQSALSALALSLGSPPSAD